MSFDFNHFQDYLNNLRVATKEAGVVTLGQTLLGGQKYLLEELERGMQDGVREFVILKGRQLGISTFTLALDMYWLFGHSDTPGMLVTHDEPAREQFRAIFELYYANLPDQWKQGIVQHNRNQLLLENRSMLQYKVAGTKPTSSKTLGRSAAISYGHFTEVAFWGDPEQIPSLKATMAEHNPDRFFINESTANGFNHYYDMWEDAIASVTQRAVFIAWWRHDFYRAARGSKIWRTYWGEKGRPKGEEIDLVKRVKKEYDFDLSDEQLAWRRWMRAEKVTDEMALAQEYPSFPEEAFVATGSKFFTGGALSDAYKRVLKEPAPEGYRIHIGQEFTDTKLNDVPERMATLRVWSEPESEERGKDGRLLQPAYYAVGADPAYGSSDKSDRFCIEVVRCWANHVEQVAEFCTVDIAPYTFAWVIAYLAGCYRPCVYNIELNGPGTAVIQEIENLRRQASKALRGVQTQKTMRDVVGKMSEFLYVREDSIHKRPSGTHTLTTERIKDTYMSTLKDNFERGILQVHSKYLLDEMKSVVRDGGRIEAQNNAKDDRVVSIALAVKAWQDQLRSKLINQNIVWVPEEARVEGITDSPATPLGRNVKNYLEQIGYLEKPRVETGVRAYNIPSR